jgi:mannose-6-phosphate isomerase-like protein (cupin superfamily)
MIAMMMPQRSHASTGMLILVGCAAIALPSLIRDSGAQAHTLQQPIPNEPVQLPSHRYDLPATLLTAAQLEAHKAKMLADKDDDVPINMVKAGGGSDKHQVGISIVYRLKGQSNPNFAVHDDVAEVYHVLEGKGRMLLGGKVVDWQRRPTSAGNGPGSGGTKSEGAKEIQIAKGDVLIIPAGTPHRWLMADEFTAYTVVRIDPDGVTPLLNFK